MNTLKTMIVDFVMRMAFYTGLYVDTTQPAKPDFESMTKAQLAEYADANGIKIDKRKKKADIISVLLSS